MTVRNIKKNLAGAEDLLHGIGVETQSRGGAVYEMHKLDTYVPTYDVTEMQRSSLTFMRLYGTDTAYTDYRRNPTGTVGIPSDLGGVWEPISSSDLPVCGNFTYGAYVFSSDCVVGYNNSFMRWQGALPKVVAVGSTPATSGGTSSTAWVDRTDLTLRSDLNIVVKVFEAVADMIADASLVIGQKCRTLGYYDVGDGGANDYEIVAAATGTNDGGSYIDLSGSGFQAKGLFIDRVVNVKQFGAKGDGISDDTDCIDAALSSGICTITAEKDKIYNVRGGVLYTRKYQTFNLNGATLRLKDSAGTDRKTIMEQDDYSSVINGVIDGNWSANSADKESWATHDAAPLAQGLYTSRLQTNGGSYRGSIGCHFDNLLIKDTIRSSVVVTGSKVTGGTVTLSNAEADHWVYFSGASNCGIETVFGSGNARSECVTFGTNDQYPALNCYINNLYIKDPRQGEYQTDPADRRSPNYLSFRPMVTADFDSTARIGSLVIDDVGDDSSEPDLTKKTLLIERNWVVDFGLIKIRCNNIKGRNPIAINNGRASVNTLEMDLIGNPAGGFDVINVTSNSANSFRTGINIDYADIDVSENLQTDMRFLVNSSSSININTLQLKVSAGLFHRSVAGNDDADTTIGNVKIFGGFTNYHTMTDGTDVYATFNILSNRVESRVGTAMPINLAKIIKLNGVVPGVINSFTNSPTIYEFTVIGDGNTTINQTSLIKLLGGVSILTVSGVPYNFKIVHGVAYQY